MKNKFLLIALTTMALSNFSFAQMPFGTDKTKNDIVSVTSKKDSSAKAGAFPSYIHFSINTGFLSLTRFNDASQLGLPLMIFAERSGRLGVFDYLPNYVYYGGYFRYSKQQYNFYENTPYSYISNATDIGFGVRATVSILPLIADFSGKPMNGTGPLDFYAGFQVGYDYFFYDQSSYYYYYGYYGFSSGIKWEPVVGARFYPVKGIGFHAELGGTSNRTFTVGIIFRKAK